MALDQLERYTIEQLNTLAANPEWRPPSGYVNSYVVSNGDNPDTVYGIFSDGSVKPLYIQDGFEGTLNPAGGNIDYPEATSGDIFVVISDGTIGAPAIDITTNDWVICINDTAGGPGAAADFVINEGQLTPSELETFLCSIGITCVILAQGVKDQTPGTADVEFGSSDVKPTQTVTTTSSNVVIETGTTQARPAGAGATAKTGDILMSTGLPGTPFDGQSGVSGNISILTGDTPAPTGAGDSGKTGDILMKTGNTGISDSIPGDSGQVEIGSGDAAAAVAGGGQGGDSGDLLLYTGGSGEGATSGDTGDIFMFTFNASQGTTDGGNGGAVYITAGDGGNGVANLGGNGGDIVLQSGGKGTGGAGDGAVGSIKLIGNIAVPVIGGLTAFAGGGIANATEMQRRYNRVTTVAAPNDSVKLLNIKDAPVGTAISIRNDGANSMDIFPSDAGGQINGGGAGVAVALAPGNSTTFVQETAGMWYTFD